MGKEKVNEVRRRYISKVTGVVKKGKEKVKEARLAHWKGVKHFARILLQNIEIVIVTLKKYSN